MTEVSLLAHPAVPLLVAAALVAVAPRRVGSTLVLLAPVVAGWSLLQVRGSAGPTLDLYGVTLMPLRVDDLAFPFAAVFVLATLLVNLYGLGTAAARERVSGLVTAAAAIGVVVAGDLVTLFLWWELKAVSSTVVVLAGGSEACRSAASRYLLVHLVGGAALLAGIAWHLADGATDLAVFEAMTATPATLLIALGMLVAAAAVPLHTWLPDAYPRASVTGTVLLSAFTTKAALYALARGFPGLELLVWVGVLMALYGVVYAMVQDDLRGLLSYHVVSQVGFMVAAVGVGTSEAINGATAHAAVNVVGKGLLLMGVGVVIHATGRDRATELGGLGRLLPAALALYLVGAMTLSGVPGLPGFASKELIVHALGDAGFSVAVIALKIASVGTLLSTLGKLPHATWIAPPAGEVAGIHRRPPRSMYVAMGAATAVCLAYGVVPSLLPELLPTVPDSSPWTSAKLLENGQLLVVAALGFWLLRAQLAPHRGTVLDVGDLVRARRVRHGARDHEGDAGAAQRTSGALLERLASLPSTPPTWWFGVVLLTASLAVMIGSVLR